MTSPIPTPAGHKIVAFVVAFSQLSHLICHKQDTNSSKNLLHVLWFCNFHICFVRNRIKIKRKTPMCIFSLQHSHPVCHKQDKKNQVKNSYVCISFMQHSHPICHEQDTNQVKKNPMYIVFSQLSHLAYHKQAKNQAKNCSAFIFL